MQQWRTTDYSNTACSRHENGLGTNSNVSDRNFAYNLGSDRLIDEHEGTSTRDDRDMTINSSSVSSERNATSCANTSQQQQQQQHQPWVTRADH
jgi:hypothetical protein